MVTSPVRAVLGDAFDALSRTHRGFYDAPGTTVLAGTAHVWRSDNPIAGLFCALAGLPAAGRAVPVTLTVTRGDGPERWARRFGKRRYASRFAAANGLLVERMGPFTNVFRLVVIDGRLHLDLVGFRVLGAPLPAWLRPICHAVEATDGEALTFDIPITMPGMGPIIHYSGRLLPAESH